MTATFTAEFAEAGNEITILHDGEDADLVIVDGQPHPAILGHEDMGEEWAPELLDAALTGAGWVRTGNWDTASRSATVTRA